MISLLRRLIWCIWKMHSKKMQLFAVVSLSVNFKNPIKRQRQHKAPPPCLIWEEWASPLTVRNDASQTQSSGNAYWLLCAWNVSRCTPNTCHRQIIHTGLRLERKCSDSGCAGVDYEVRNDELLKEMMLQMFPPYSWQMSPSFRQGAEWKTSLKDPPTMWPSQSPVRVEVRAVVSGRHPQTRPSLTYDVRRKSFCCHSTVQYIVEFIMDSKIQTYISQYFEYIL